MSTNDGVCRGPNVDSKTIGTNCRILSFAVPGKAGDMFGLALRALEGLQEQREVRMPVVPL